VKEEQYAQSHVRIHSVSRRLVVLPLAAKVDWFIDEVPPADAKPLSEVIKSLEDQGYKTIEEVDFDDDEWEIKVHQADGSEVELHVNAISGQITQKK
jgi:uncharacterized membrane protein YkoI